MSLFPLPFDLSASFKNIYFLFLLKSVNVVRILYEGHNNSILSRIVLLFCESMEALSIFFFCYSLKLCCNKKENLFIFHTPYVNIGRKQ